MNESGEKPFSKRDGGRAPRQGKEGQWRSPGGEGMGWAGSEGLRWDPLHINSPDIDEMIRRGLGRQS